ncbi:MAG: guanylate kinase [Bacteroidales bacterium]|nr:guanylate kinase [Bacteroidales bacterium]
MAGKLIIFSAPSGAGKTTIVKRIVETDLNLEFSISATSRKIRNGEVAGKDYYFLTPEEFKRKIDENAFIEWEEVYTNTMYGTLKSEIKRIEDDGNNILFEVDVEGGLSLKKIFGDKALSIFILPPSIEELENRLRKRATDKEEVIIERVAKAKKEISYADRFDLQIVNNDLEVAVSEIYTAIKNFIIL